MDILRWPRETLKLGLLILAVVLFEAPLRFFSYFNPRTYFRAGRIRQRTDGQRALSGNKYAVLVIWQEKEIPWYVDNILSALESLSINVLIISNRPLSVSQRNNLRSRSWRVMERDNTGRDIGAYKDGILELRDFDVDRLILLNDSVLYFKEGLLEFMSELATDDPVIVAAHENFERSPHLQSFAVSFPKVVLKNRAFRRFWSRYLPISTRRYCIHKGEIGLSTALRKVPVDIRVVFSLKRLRDEVERLDVSGLCALRSMLNVPFRSLYLGDKELIVRLSSPEECALMQSRLLERLAWALASGSPIHIGAFLFNRFLRSPILKRDIYFRLQYDLPEIEHLLDVIGVRDRMQRDAIVSEFRRRGSFRTLNPIDKVRFAAGII